MSNICLLIAKARQAQVPVFFARHTGPNDSPLSEQSPLTQLIPEMDVNVERDIVFIKKHPSCFRDTGMQLQLIQRGVKRVVIAGMKTEFCVDTTCKVASELGFKTVLISDAQTTVDNVFLSADEIIAHHNVTLAGPFVTLATADNLRFAPD